MIQRALSEIGKPLPYHNAVYRIVETQEYAATIRLVDNLDEQHLLEQMLDEVKPPYQNNTQHLHYLISTPFRYPPLNYGSRFGDISMPSYFYASESIKTTLAECAYYRFVFLSGMSVSYEKPINSEHMTFSVVVKSKLMADLAKITSTNITDALTSADNYLFSQTLGKNLTQAHNFNMIRFISARDKVNGINVALTTAEIIRSKKPENNVNWICQTTTSKISFNAHGIKPISFTLNDFLINELLPIPT